MSDNGELQKILRDLYRSHVSRVVLFLLLIGVAAAAVAWQRQTTEEFLDTFVTELAIASFIAAVLLFVSDRLLKESLFSEIRSNISKSLGIFHQTAFDLHHYSRLPDDLRDRVSAKVLAAPIIKRDVTYKYLLTDIIIGGESGYKAEISLCCTYDNISLSEQQFEVKESLPPFGFSQQMADYAFHSITSKIRGKGRAIFRPL